MPDIDAPIRLQSAKARATALVTDAETEITRSWSGRSWSEVLGNVWSNRNWVAGQGLKVAINMTVGAWISPLAETGLDKIGSQYAKETLKQGWALVEDTIKGTAEKIVSETPSVVAGAISTISARVRGTAAPVADLDIVETVTSLKDKFTELGMRVKNVQAAAQNGAFRYCDDVHWAVRELAHAEACRLTIINDCDKSIAYLEAMKLHAAGALPNAAMVKDEFTRAAERVVNDDVTISHKKHQNFGILGAAWRPVAAFNAVGWSCSKEHCFGKVP